MVQEARCADREDIFEDAVDEMCVESFPPFLFETLWADVFFVAMLVPWAMEVEPDWKF